MEAQNMLETVVEIPSNNEYVVNQLHTPVFWIGNFVIPFAIAVISFWINRRDTNNRILYSEARGDIADIIANLNILREKACTYWSATVLVPAKKTELENDIKCLLQDIRSKLQFMYTCYIKIKESVHKIQTGNNLIKLNKLVTGGSFETERRVIDKNKADEIIEIVNELKRDILELKKMC